MYSAAAWIGRAVEALSRPSIVEPSWGQLPGSSSAYRSAIVSAVACRSVPVRSVRPTFPSSADRTGAVALAPNAGQSASGAHDGILAPTRRSRTSACWRVSACGEPVPSWASATTTSRAVALFSSWASSAASALSRGPASELRSAASSCSIVQQTPVEKSHASSGRPRVCCVEGASDVAERGLARVERLRRHKSGCEPIRDSSIRREPLCPRIRRNRSNMAPATQFARAIIGCDESVSAQR